MMLSKCDPFPRTFWPPIRERKPQPPRQRMTIAAGFRFHDGLLLCADTQITTPGYMKQAASKIVPISFVSNGGSKALFAITGSVPFAHMAIEHCRRSLANLPPEQMTTADMMIALEDTIQGFCDDHLFRHPHHERGLLTVEMLVAIWSHLDKNLTMLAARENAVNIVHDYECLGAGQFLTNYLIPKIFRHSSMGLADTVHIALHVLRETKNYVDSCGGGSEIIVLRKDGTFGMPDAIDFASGEQISQAFDDAMRRVFVQASDINTTEKHLREEFEMAFTIVQLARQQLIERHQESVAHGDGSLRTITEHIVDRKVIKS
jgi:20S proteasome alpha/beta subunit